jgi:hypothetical protein
VAKKNKKNITQAEQPAPNQEKAKPSDQGWISIRTGIIVIGVMSLAMTVWTGSTTIPALGFWEGLLWALITGGSLWLIFLIGLLFHRFLRGGSGR